MKKNYFLFIITSILFNNILLAQNVNIPDVALKNYLLSNTALNNDGDFQNISVDEATKFRSDLIIIVSEIESLEGLQSFTSLNFLYIAGTKIKNTNFLPPNLTRLYCDSNLIETLTNLPESLTFLSCRNNKIESLPSILPANLKTLDCSINLLTYLPNFPQEFTSLNCSNNKIYSISNLSVNVIDINCSNNNIISLPIFGDSLRSLICNNNNITKLPDALPLALNYLDISNTNITKLPNLPQRIQTLGILNTPITCLPYLPSTLYSVQINRNKCVPNIANIKTLFYDENSQWFKPEICTDINNPNGCSIYPVVKGKIFYDSNNDNIFSNGVDYPLSYHNINMSGNIYMTDKDGNYSINAQNLNIVYGINMMDIPNSFIGVKVSDTVRFKNYGEIRESKDFIIKSTNKIDVKVKASNWVIRPGFQTIYYLKIKNIGTTIETVKINQEFDNQHLTFDSSDIANNNILENNLEWNLINLKPFEERIIKVYFTCKSTTLLGTDIFSDINISINNIDEDLSNNNVKINNIVRGSYDPNDIAVNHGNNVWIGDIKNNVDFDYTIRFQNTGTDTAFTVIVKDTLPSQLNLNSIKTLTTSHDYTFSLIGNVATWTFKKINLPDSTTNKVGSNGFIKYTIKPLTTLQVDDKIKNTAHIYFDFNEAIVTNTVNTKVFAVVGLENESTNNLFSVYPNPNNGIFTLNTNNEKCYVEVSNITGEIVYQTSINETTKLDLQNLAKGLYFIKVISNDKSETKKLVIE